MRSTTFQWLQPTGIHLGPQLVTELGKLKRLEFDDRLVGCVHGDLEVVSEVTYELKATILEKWEENRDLAPPNPLANYLRTTCGNLGHGMWEGTTTKMIDHAGAPRRHDRFGSTARDCSHPAASNCFTSNERQRIEDLFDRCIGQPIGQDQIRAGDLDEDE